MSDQPANPLSTESYRDGQRPRWWDYMEILVRWRRFIIINLVSITSLTIIISLLLPQWYKSTATLLSPKRQDIFGSLNPTSSVLRSLGGAGLRGFGQSSQAYNFFAILKSRTASEAVVRKFDLIRVYGVPNESMEKAIRELSGNVSFEEESDDYISIEVYDKDPQRAADMANYYVELLNEVSTALGTTEARNNREFVEGRLIQARQSLSYAEDTLRRYQEKSGMMISPEQTETISAIAGLYGTKAKKEVELAVLERTMGSDNEVVKRTKLELRELDRKLATFPELGLESFRLYRDVVIQQKIVEFLIPVYEQARIDEQKDIPVVLVLDRAVPAERKARPQRLLIVMSVSTISLFSLIAIVFAMHGIVRRKEPNNAMERNLRRQVSKVVSLYRMDVHG
jgi:tyrosine-protein kinase Etk/Wzc